MPFNLSELEVTTSKLECFQLGVSTPCDQIPVNLKPGSGWGRRGVANNWAMSQLNFLYISILP